MSSTADGMFYNFTFIMLHGLSQ